MRYGSDPNLLATPFLANAAMGFVQEELFNMEASSFDTVGKGVESVLKLLEEEGKLDALQCLWGFPHPSGANGHRHTQFAANQARMKAVIKSYFG